MCDKSHTSSSCRCFYMHANSQSCSMNLQGRWWVEGRVFGVGGVWSCSCLVDGARSFLKKRRTRHRRRGGSFSPCKVARQSWRAFARVTSGASRLSACSPMDDWHLADDWRQASLTRHSPSSDRSCRSRPFELRSWSASSRNTRDARNRQRRLAHLCYVMRVGKSLQARGACSSR